VSHRGLAADRFAASGRASTGSWSHSRRQSLWRCRRAHAPRRRRGLTRAARDW